MRRGVRLTFGIILAGIAALMAISAVNALHKPGEFPGFYAAIAAMTGIGSFFLLRSPKA